MQVARQLFTKAAGAGAVPAVYGAVPAVYDAVRARLEPWAGGAGRLYGRPEPDAGAGRWQHMRPV